MVDFFVGGKVVCVDDSPITCAKYFHDPVPVLGRVYTVARITSWPSLCISWPSLCITELDTRNPWGYLQSRFRPLEETSKAIELFRKLAVDATTKKKITVKEPAE